MKAEMASSGRAHRMLESYQQMQFCEWTITMLDEASSGQSTR